MSRVCDSTFSRLKGLYNQNRVVLVESEDYVNRSPIEYLKHCMDFELATSSSCFNVLLPPGRHDLSATVISCMQVQRKASNVIATGQREALYANRAVEDVSRTTGTVH